MIDSAPLAFRYTVLIRQTEWTITVSDVSQTQLLMKTDLFINPTKSNYSPWNACRSWSRRGRKSRKFPDLNHTLWPLSSEWHSQAIYCSPLGVLLRKVFGFVLLRQVCTETGNTDMPDTCQVISLRILWNRTYFLRKVFLPWLLPWLFLHWFQTGNGFPEETNHHHHQKINYPDAQCHQLKN